MKNIEKANFYSPEEEKINILSHAIGLVFSIIAFVALVLSTILTGNIWQIVSFSVFGVSLILLYTASTMYHSAKVPEVRNRLKIFDHAAIFVLIAGTYTPFALVTLKGTIGWMLFGTTWGIALSGIILKIFFTGKYKLVSTLLYVFMGWIVIFVIDPLTNSLSQEGLHWLIAGGIYYTIGAILYAIKKIKFNHAIFHIFVMVGSFCHFFSVFFYVLPNE